MKDFAVKKCFQAKRCKNDLLGDNVFLFLGGVGKEAKKT